MDSSELYCVTKSSNPDASSTVRPAFSINSFSACPSGVFLTSNSALAASALSALAAPWPACSSMASFCG